MCIRVGRDIEEARPFLERKQVCFHLYIVRRDRGCTKKLVQKTRISLRSYCYILHVDF